MNISINSNESILKLNKEELKILSPKRKKTNLNDKYKKEEILQKFRKSKTKISPKIKKLQKMSGSLNSPKKYNNISSLKKNDFNKRKVRQHYTAKALFQNNNLFNNNLKNTNKKSVSNKTINFIKKNTKITIDEDNMLIKSKKENPNLKKVENEIFTKIQ